ncbi:Thiamin biosynthesis lipoprotein ApbE [Pedobacter cryoconitis]|uniref:FAD:protein FMN transferase n=1 Tax=Pedobacter cryoconitis TaxID=188932 RepID=A0A127V8B1_9SPHI|nr:FAD:protein FMN transferase [Pedobacter cryoconitis]AMP97554.1 Thiamin biosynthesis lipoprotein ApbE [Pedobacter cryoconitis]
MADATYNRVLKLMGNRFEFTVIAGHETAGEKAIDAAIAEVSRIEELLSTFKQTSQTSLINQCAGIKPVKVDPEVIELIQRAVKISDITQGAFDISYGSIDKSLWNFDVNMTSLPDFETARQSVSLINYQHVIIDPENSTVMLKQKGMRIGFGGIGKGYAADRAKQVLQRIGIEHGIVNAAGDLITWGSQSTGKPWTIGIADPDQSSRPFSALNISNMAIATSGDYEKYATINGRRYSHTIDPKTGLPVSGIKSVSIICPSAELADALATPVIVMGVQIGLDLINQLKHVACIIIDDQDQLYTSKNINVKQ